MGKGHPITTHIFQHEHILGAHEIMMDIGVFPSAVMILDAAKGVGGGVKQALVGNFRACGVSRLRFGLFRLFRQMAGDAAKFIGAKQRFVIVQAVFDARA